MKKILVTIPYPHWVEINEEDKLPVGCLLVFAIPIIIGLIFF